MRWLSPLLLPPFLLLANDQATWSQFSLEPVTTAGPPNSRRIFRKGVMRAKSISARSLIGIAAGVSPARVLGPEWIDTQRYSIAAILSDDSAGRLRTRSSDGPASDEAFRSLFRQEIASRFQLKMHPESRSRNAFVAVPVSGGRLKVRQSKALEGGQINRKGTPVANVYSTVDARGFTFLEFCDWLERQLDAPVIAGSTLPAGTWDFHVRWRTGDRSSLLAAIKDQVGLGLAEGNVTVEYLIVDHVEKPASRP